MSKNGVIFKGGAGPGHVLIKDNTAMKIKKAKKKAEKENKPKFKVVN